MAFSPFDSPIFRHLYGDNEVAKLFSDSAEIRAMLLVEGILAKVQGDLGLIPKDSAFFIHRSSMEIQIDPSGLAESVGTSGVAVPALVDAFRKAMEAPDHAQYLHWGATSQDIVDTGLMLRIRQYLGIVDARLDQLISDLTNLAIENRDVVIAARTRSQIATPTTFGAKIAGWIAPLERHKARLNELKKRLLNVSMAGASSNYAAMGTMGFKVEAALAKELKLGVSPTPWHSARDNIAELAGAITLISGTLGKIGSDIIMLAQTEVSEIKIVGGGSSTMPHKSNPVAAEVMVTMARQNATLLNQIHNAVIHTHERDGVSWAQEWHALPQICIGCSVSLSYALKLVSGLKPNPEQMLSNINATNGQMFAEAAMFALSKHMPRPDAQKLVKECSFKSKESGKHLRELLETHSDYSIDWDSVFNPSNNVGLAMEIVDRLK